MGFLVSRVTRGTARVAQKMGINCTYDKGQLMGPRHRSAPMSGPRDQREPRLLGVARLVLLGGVAVRLRCAQVTLKLQQPVGGAAVGVLPVEVLADRVQDRQALR